MRVALLTLLLATLAWARAAAQETRAAVIPDSVTIGDVFRAAVRVTVPAGARVAFPDTLAVPANLEAAARRELSIDSSRTDVRTYTAVYALTAWRPGSYELPAARVTIELPDGGQRVNVRFPTVVVQSVLPVDTAGIDAQPPKDVIGPSRLLWPLVLALVGLAALLLVLFWLYRRRRPAEAGPEAAVPARDWALAELDRVRTLGLLEAGDIKGFYTAVSGVLREYVARLEAAWSPDLTTGELERTMVQTVLAAQAARAASASAASASTPGVVAPGAGTPGAVPPGAMPATGGPGAGEQDAVATAAEPVSVAVELLEAADLVKFAAERPTPREAEEVWFASRAWVATFDWPPPAPEPAEEEAR